MWKRGKKQPKKSNTNWRRRCNNDNRKKKNKGYNLYKTEFCETFEEFGECKYGVNCQYAHGKHELREKPHIEQPSAYKTVRCKKYWSKDCICPYGNKCKFVHEKASIDAKKNIKTMAHKKYKTKECDTFKETGSCPYGDKCAFIHIPNIKRSVSEEHELEILNKVNFNDTKIKRDNNGNLDYLSMFMPEDMSTNLSTNMLNYSDNQESKLMKLLGYQIK